MWRYRDEGNAHVVFHRHEESSFTRRRILRVRKITRQDLNQPLHVDHALHWWHDEDGSNPLCTASYASLVGNALLGKHYVNHSVQHVKLETSEMEELTQIWTVGSSRTTSLHTLSCDAVLFNDHTFHEKHSITLEWKPKWSIHHNETQMCRNCAVKILRGHDAPYCALDMFAFNDRERMTHGWYQFWNMDSSHLKLWDDQGNFVTTDWVNETTRQVLKNVVGDVADEARNRLIDILCFILCEEPLLKRLALAQHLLHHEIELLLNDTNAQTLMSQLLQSPNRRDSFLQLIEYTNQRILSVERELPNESSPLREYLVCKTLKDCSIMLTIAKTDTPYIPIPDFDAFLILKHYGGRLSLEEKDEEPHEPGLVAVRLNNEILYFHYRLHVIDLDGKSIQERDVELERNIRNLNLTGEQNRKCTPVFLWHN